MSKFVVLLFIIWKANGETERWRKKAETAPLYWFISQLCTRTGNEPLATGSQEPNPDLLDRWYELKYLVHYLLPPRVPIITKPESGIETGLQWKHYDMGCGHPNLWLNCQATYTFTFFVSKIYWQYKTLKLQYFIMSLELNFSCSLYSSSIV